MMTIQPSEAPVNINRISYLGIPTNDFEAMSEFVRDVLGLRSSHRDAPDLGAG